MRSILLLQPNVAILLKEGLQQLTDLALSLSVNLIKPCIIESFIEFIEEVMVLSICTADLYLYKFPIFLQTV